MAGGKSQVASAGPHRWSYVEYDVAERATPFGRRYEVRSPKDEVVAVCKLRRSDPGIVFYSDDREKEELFRLEPTKVRLFDRAFDAVDALSGRTFAQIRKKVYKPLDKSEWFLHNADGELLGMITETAPHQSFLRRILPVDRLFSRAWALHWGQSICGVIQPRRGMMGERMEIDLSLDKRQEVDRRLVVGVTVALRAEGHHAGGNGEA